MKVAFVVNGFPLVSETFVLNQIVSLIRRGHHVDIYAERPSDTVACVDAAVSDYGLIERTRYRTSFQTKYRDPSRRAVELLLKWAWRNVRHRWRSLNLTMLRDCLESDRLDAAYDIVHCHFGPNGRRMVAARQAGDFEAPVITTFHGYDVN